MGVDLSPLKDDVVEEDLVPYEKIDPRAEYKVHIVNPPDNPHISRGFPDMEASEVVRIARAMGWEVVALCGYRFVPKHNPDEINDVCEKCLAVAGHIMREDG